MKKGSILLIVSLFFVCIVASLTSCGKSGAPDCASKDIQSKVIDSLGNNLKQLAEHEAERQLRNFGKDENFEIRKKNSLDTINEIISAMTLEDIKLISKDDNIKECKCSADIIVVPPTSSNKSSATPQKLSTVKYTAQYASDGVIVKVTEFPNWEKDFKK